MLYVTSKYERKNIKEKLNGKHGTLLKKYVTNQIRFNIFQI